MSEFSIDNPDVQPRAFESLAQLGAIQGAQPSQLVASGPATTVTSLSGLRGDLNFIAGGAVSGFTITIAPAGSTITLGVGVAATITPANVSASGNVTATKLLIQGVGAVLTIAANAITPTNCIHHLNSAGLLKTINVPIGFTSGSIDIIPDQAFTYDATGNIVVPAGGGTAVVNRTIRFTWDTGKWYPSY